MSISAHISNDVYMYTLDYHSTIVRAMDISEMDPSMLLGFICQSEQEFNDFCDRVERVNSILAINLFFTEL